MGVEFRHLGALAAVAREGSFRRAAESLGYVQSAISSQIARLERAVGTQLIERSSGTAGATLTPAGHVLLGHVEEILARFDAARVDLSSLAEGTTDLVRVSVLEGAGQRRLPAILRAFVARFPSAQVVLDEDDGSEHAFDRVASGELDLLISELPLPSGPFEYTVLEHDPYVLVVAADSEFAADPGRLDLDQLSRLPLILPAATRPDDPLAARLRDGWLDQPPWLRPRGAAAAQALVGAGLGVSVLPRLAVDPDDASTTMIALLVPLPDRRIVLVRHRERAYSDAALGFIEIAASRFGSPPAGAPK
jgi:DNA-binding transcriptional LysR family regulator